MALSTQSVVSDGTLTVLDITFDYFDRDEVNVYFNDVLNPSAWSWSGSVEKRILFSPAVSNGVEVYLQRRTAVSALRHIFSGGAAFTKETLDEDLLQGLRVAQEASETVWDGTFRVNLNMRNHKITNLAPGTAPTDAVNLSQYQADAGGAYQAKLDAEAARDNINNRIFPGSYMIAPVARPNGGALQEGDRFLRTDGVEFIRLGGLWVDYRADAAASASAAAGSASAAAGSASAANTSAGNAANQVTLAANQVALAAAQVALAAGYASNANNSAISSAAAGKAYASINAANTDTGLAVGASFTAPLADGSMQTYTKTNTSGSAATAIGSPLLGKAALTSQQLKMLRSELPDSRNRFVRSRITAASIVNANTGVVTAGFTGYFAVFPFAVDPGGFFVCTAAIYGDGSNYGVAFYDIAGGYVSGILGAQAAGTAVPVPANAAYAQFGVLGTFNALTLDIRNGSTAPTAFKDHDFTDAATQRIAQKSRADAILGRAENLFVDSLAKSGFVVSATTGVESAAAGFFSTGFMTVVPGTITSNMSAITGAGFGWAFYNSASPPEFISGVAGPVAAGVNVPVPFGASQARATFHESSSGNRLVRQKLYIEQSSTNTAEWHDTPASVAEAWRNAQLMDNVYAPAPRQLFDATRITNTGAGLLLNGTIDTSGTWAAYSVTDFMPVEPSTPIVANLTLTFGAQLGIIWYDKRKRYIDVAGGNLMLGVPSANAPREAAFWRTTINTNQASVWPRLEMYNASALPALGSGSNDMRYEYPWAGLNFITDGDSNTASTDGTQQWVRGEAQRIKAVLLANYGVSGRKAWQLLSGKTAADYSAANLTRMQIGTNDYNGAGSTGGTPLGSITDTPSATSTSTFYAALKYYFETMLTWNPTLRLAYYTPYRRGNDTTPNSLGFTLKDYRDAAVAVCQLYSIPVLDLYNRAGFNSFNFANFMNQPDSGLNLHATNAAVNARLINQCARFLNGL